MKLAIKVKGKPKLHVFNSVLRMVIICFICQARKKLERYSEYDNPRSWNLFSVLLQINYSNIKLAVDLDETTVSARV